MTVMLKAHKMKLFPTSEQQTKFRRCEEIAKATYNQALRMWEDDYRRYLGEISAVCAQYSVNPLVDAPRCVKPRYKRRADLEKQLLDAGVAQAVIPKPRGFDWI